MDVDILVGGKDFDIINFYEPGVWRNKNDNIHKSEAREISWSDKNLLI